MKALALLLISSLAFAAPERVLDGQKLKNGSVTFTLPTADGTADQCLKTNGVGVWSFDDCGGGGGGGANTSLSNLASVGINTDLVFDTGGLASIKTKDENSSQALILQSGNALNSSSGYVLVRSGQATQGTGSVSLNTADTTTPDFGSGYIQNATGNTTGTGTSGDILLWTGSVVDGISGSIQLSPGEVSGSGTRGKVVIRDGSEGTVGHVWTSTGVNGEGAWQPAAGGGGDTLLNMARIDVNLINDIDAQPFIDTGLREIQTAAGVPVFKINGPSVRMPTNVDILSEATADALIVRSSLSNNDGGLVVKPATGAAMVNLQGTMAGLGGVGDLLIQNEGGDLYLKTLRWPTADGADGDCLKTNGAAVLSFGACGGGGMSWSTPVNASIVPDTNLGYNIGAQGAAFNNVYIQNLVSGAGAAAIQTAPNIVLVGNAASQLRFDDPSLAGASNGQVWTLVDQTTGQGSWQPAAAPGAPTWRRFTITFQQFKDWHAAGGNEWVPLFQLAPGEYVDAVAANVTTPFDFTAGEDAATIDFKVAGGSTPSSAGAELTNLQIYASQAPMPAGTHQVSPITGGGELVNFSAPRDFVAEMSWFNVGPSGLTAGVVDVWISTRNLLDVPAQPAPNVP